MPITVATDYFLWVQDFVNGYIGPFPTRYAALDHYKWCRDVRGDGATLMAVLTELPDQNDPESAGIVMTPEEDRNWKP